MMFSTVPTFNMPTRQSNALKQAFLFSQVDDMVTLIAAQKVWDL